MGHPKVIESYNPGRKLRAIRNVKGEVVQVRPAFAEGNGRLWMVVLG